jgi:2-hydroxy-3-oxopropionate reductase
MKLALEAGKEYGMDLKGSTQVAETMKAAIADGHGELDHSGIVLEIEK